MTESCLLSSLILNGPLRMAYDDWGQVEHKLREYDMTVSELYDETIKPLPPSERLRLATLILNDIPPEALASYRDAWSDEDYQDFATASWQHIERSLGDSGDA